VNHGSTPAQIDIYKAEPYVVAADVYSVDQHIGRAGWTWYTGSAGWMYRLMVESVLGLYREADTLRLDPCIPDEWVPFSIHYQYKNTTYHIHFTNTAVTQALNRLMVDGAEQPLNTITLVDDGQEHYCELYISRSI
jgi:cellobiose phosphorylase